MLVSHIVSKSQITKIWGYDFFYRRNQIWGGIRQTVPRQYDAVAEHCGKKNLASKQSDNFFLQLSDSNDQNSLTI